MSNPLLEYTASSVKAAIAKAGKSKTEISEISGIPYSTLNRKLAAKTEFSLTELFTLAQTLDVPPSDFTPPIFQRSEVA